MWSLDSSLLWKNPSICRFSLRYLFRVEGQALIFSCKNSKIATICWKAIDRRMLEPTKKKIWMAKGKGEAATDSRRGTITLKIKPHTCQRLLEGTNKPFVYQDWGKGAVIPMRDWTRPSFACLRLSCLFVSAVPCHGDRVSGSSSPGRCSMWHNSSLSRSPLAPS